MEASVQSLWCGWIHSVCQKKKKKASLRCVLNMFGVHLWEIGHSLNWTGYDLTIHTAYHGKSQTMQSVYPQPTLTCFTQGLNREGIGEVLSRSGSLEVHWSFPREFETVFTSNMSCFLWLFSHLQYTAWMMFLSVIDKAGKVEVNVYITPVCLSGLCISKTSNWCRNIS